MILQQTCLFLLQDRVNKSVQPQVLARDSLLSGQYYAYQNGITKPKSYSKSGTTWVLPAGCPAGMPVCMHNARVCGSCMLSGSLPL